MVLSCKKMKGVFISIFNLMMKVGEKINGANHNLYREGGRG